LSKLNHYLMLVLLALFLLFPGISTLPVTDRDEAHFAQASRQMLQTGEYFRVRFQDKTRFQKPPGINWLQAGSVHLFSDAQANTIWPYRLPSVLGGLFSVLLLYFFGRQFLKPGTAFLASSLFATTMLLVVESHIAVIDSSLLFAVLLMQAALWHCYEKGGKETVHWGWAVCFWFAMAYGVLLKGITPLVGILTIISLCLVERRWDWVRSLRPCRGLLFFILITLAWLGMLNAAENSNYLLQMINKDLLPKLQGGHESHGKPPLFHLAILPLTFWPASLFLWQGGIYAKCNRHQKIIKFLLAWLLPTWLFFEIMPTKLPQYVLPVFPAIALLCALAIEQEDNKKLPGKWLHFLQLMWGLLSIGLALCLLLIPYLVLQEISSLNLLIFISITIMTLLAIYFAWQGAYRWASLIVIVATLAIYPLIFTQLLPSLEPIWLARNTAQLVQKNELPKGKPLLVVGFTEPSLVFNLNTDLVKFTENSLAERIIKEDASRLVLIDQPTYVAWQKNGIKLTVKAQTQGFNYSKGRWLTLYLVARKEEKR
jgi:4-amino-4-deoxy-L-arabinose transferase-like glycosyltransferase